MTIRNEKQLAGCIDHTLLSVTATSEQIRQLCEEAKTYGFHTVSVNPRWVALSADQLQGSKVAVGGVVSLPLGADSTAIKVAQAREAIFAGADEIDMVADLAAIIEGDLPYLTKQLQAVLKVCRSMRPPVLLKVINRRQMRRGFRQDKHGNESCRRSNCQRYKTDERKRTTL